MAEEKPAGNQTEEERVTAEGGKDDAENLKATTADAGTASPPEGGTKGMQAPHFNDLPKGQGVTEVRNLDFVLDLPLQLTVELGRSRMIISDLLQLTQGSVIELNKKAGESVDVMVNRKLVARGKVVVVNEKFGIRLTDVVSPAERVRQLR